MKNNQNISHRVQLIIAEALNLTIEDVPPEAVQENFSEWDSMAYLSILSTLKNELRHHNLAVNIKSGFVLCGGGAQALGCEELVREFFTRRVKIGVVQRDRVSGLETILMDYRYASSIGLLLHQEDLPQIDSIKSRRSNGVIGKLREVLVGNF